MHGKSTTAILGALLFALTCSCSTPARGASSGQLSWPVGPEAVPRAIPWTSVDPASLRGIAAGEGGEVWVAGSGGTLVRITREGRRRKSVAPPGTGELDFRDLQWLGGKIWLAMSAGPGEKSRIYKTEDRGKSWRVTYENTDPARFFNSFAFWDERRGLLISDSGDDRPVFLRTTDAGESWERVGKESIPLLVPGEVGFAASGTAVATRPGGHVWVASGGTAARVFHSPDYGDHWTVAPTPIVSGKPGTGIFSIVFRDAAHGVIVGGDYQDPGTDRGNLAWTDDGGKSWHAATVESPDGMTHKACVIDLGDGRYLAAGRLGLAYSEDDGRSWRDLPGPPFYTGVFDRETGAGYLAGADGRVGRWIMPIRPSRD